MGRIIKHPLAFLHTIHHSGAMLQNLLNVLVKGLLQIWVSQKHQKECLNQIAKREWINMKKKWCMVLCPIKFNKEKLWGFLFEKDRSLSYKLQKEKIYTQR